MLIYRAIMAGAAAVLLGMTLVQRLSGRVGPGAVAQRLGLGPWPVPGGGPAIWLHGASNGEVTSARPVLQRLLAAGQVRQVLLTANTATAVAMVQRWGIPGVRAALAPLDAFGSPGRVLRHWQPRALIIVENELWPARLAAAQAAGVPVALIGGRISARSARLWGRLAPGLIRRGLTCLAYASAQDAGSAARLLALGLPADRVGPPVMLKAGVADPDAGGSAPPPLQPQKPLQTPPRHRVLLAASTHPGEEALILAAFNQSRSRFDLLIIAPRHPRRRAELAGLIAASGPGFASRSAGASPQAGVPVFLADTMGEMPLWYAMAGATVIGGSFVPLGGHTPFEPAAAGSAILHGPFMENFAEPAAVLARTGGALAVTSEGLAAALSGLDAATQAALSRAARTALSGGPDSGALVAALVRLIDPCQRDRQPNG